MLPLRTAAAASLVWAIGGLAVSVARAWRRRAPVPAPAAGAPWRGVLYAFGAGMSPRAKESARLHPAAYAVGIVYHAAILTASAGFALALLRVDAGPRLAEAAAVVLLAGCAAGLALAARRAATPLLRAISAVDDYEANALVDAWLLAGAVAFLRPGAVPAFLAVSIFLCLYAPFGKIRHCAFFFVSRALFGARLGRRGWAGPARPPVSV